MYCSTNSDKYNTENFAFKDNAFKFHISNLHSQSISVFKFKTSLLDEQNGPVKRCIFKQMEGLLYGVLLKLCKANGTNGKAMLSNLLEVFEYREIRDFRQTSIG